MPLTAVVIAWLGKRAQPRFREQWSATGTLLTHVEETCAGHASMTAYGRHGAVMSAFREHNEVLSRAAFRASVLSGISQPTMIFLNNLGYVLVAVVGCVRVATGALSIGTVQAFVQYSRQLSGPLAQLTGLTSVTQSGVASAQRVFEVLDADELREEADGTLPSPLRGEVRFESVYFRYDQEHPLIEGLSMSADAGQNVAVVGASGAGKTTLVNLLMRYYDADGGRITLDGVDLTTVPRRRVRSVIGAVLQDDWLFQGSIADNIGYGAEDATRAEIEEAARAAHADHIIRTLPAGYDTVVDEGCAVLSAGERQLICIARAFLSDPAVLLLDEATSMVDTRTELLVRRALTSLRKGRTSFVIAHRLSTVRDADLILVVRSGAIVESGTHDELIAARGAYAELIRSQFASTGLATSGRTTDDNGRHGS